MRSPLPEIRWPHDRAAGWLFHEWLLVTLGAVIGILLAWRGDDWRQSAEMLGTTGGWAVLLTILARCPSFVAEKIRFAANYAFFFWFYSAVQWIVPALRLDTWDRALRNLDAYCFGQWPARFTGNASTPWLTDAMSAAYATYLIYLHLVLLHGMISSVAFGRRLMNRVGTAFFVGLSGYCLVPAVGPWKAFPEMYAEPLVGGPLYDAVSSLVAWGSSVYDVFPSLHVLVTVTLLAFDWRQCRTRFWWALLPAAGIVGSSLYLRYHYAVDLVAGGVCWLAVEWLCRRESECERSISGDSRELDTASRN